MRADWRHFAFARLFPIIWLLLLAALAVVLGINPIVHTHAQELPGVLIEEAFVVPDAEGTATAYLVLNNRSEQDVTLTSVASPQAQLVQLVSARGIVMANGALIPRHAELYMQPGGVRLWLQGLSAPLADGQKVQLQLTLAEGLAGTIAATVVDNATLLPDHHDYQH